MMLTFSLQSGSNGNAIYVESHGVGLLFDAGISGRQAELRMRRYGRDIRHVKAVLISHDHADHVRCAAVYQRKFGLPIWAAPETERSMARWQGDDLQVEHFLPGQTIDFGRLRVITVPTPHDAAESVAFVVEAGRKRLGILTDLGHPFDQLREWLARVDAAYLESNYDPTMLRHGRYPEPLKERIRGPHGHLSNDESAQLVAEVAGSRLRWVALAHLSEENNSPEVALRTHRLVHGWAVPLYVASRYGPSDILSL